MTSLTINQHYILAGSFPSVWQCLTFGGGHIFNDHVAVMRNVNTKEIRICKNPEVNDDGTVQWSSSTDDNHSFSIKTYRMDGYAKEAIEDLDWQEMLDIWADEESQGYPEPTIWIGETRLVDGTILLEAYED